MPSYLDLAVIAVVLVSAMLALLRGFTREVLAIVSWVAAAAVAYYFHPLALPYIRPHVPKENIAQGLSIAAVFLVGLILVSMITVKISDVILDSKIGALDRTLGFIFGGVRGFLLAVVAFVFYGWLAPDANQPEWVRNARLKPILEAGGEKLRDLVPQDIDALIANIKTKKSAPANNEEPPAENEADSGKTPEPAAPGAEKRTEAPAAKDTSAQTNAQSDQQRLDALLSGGKNTRKAR
ncbi:CvpA family protein [Methylocystis heyeri]|uniref:CvpA family protein n=1 Tax=Methylocystis heyeri TaxID=391905 RepID=A0A6B8KBP4_9HYPH|nr:CvpA family protein [Methylocystis heyeri]QGM45097.1 CvpA family protein [Methylocystis heyeri]